MNAVSEVMIHDYEKLVSCTSRVNIDGMDVISDLMRYDVEKLKSRFVFMSDSEVMEECAFIINRLKYLGVLIDNAEISETEYFAQTEPLLDAEFYICIYLAIKYLLDNGYTYERAIKGTEENRT